MVFAYWFYKISVYTIHSHNIERGHFYTFIVEYSREGNFGLFHKTASTFIIWPNGAILVYLIVTNAFYIWCSNPTHRNTFCWQNTTHSKYYIHKLVIAILAEIVRLWNCRTILSELNLHRRYWFLLESVHTGKETKGTGVSGMLLSISSIELFQQWFLFLCTCIFFFCENFVDFVTLPSLTFWRIQF